MVKVGDICSINGEDGVWYGEIVGIKDNVFEIYLIEEQEKKIWKYTEEWYEIPKDSIIKLIEIDGNGNAYKRGFRELGFDALDGTHFTRLDDPPEATVMVPLGDEDYDGPGEYVFDDFLVPDTQEDAFTFADPRNEWVRDTHQAVRQYNDWNPTGEARKIKDWIDNLDQKVCIEEDNRQFANCMHLNFIKPPV